MKINYLLVTVIALIPNILAYNILFLVPFPGPSHYVFIGKFIKELIARGHGVTSITNFKLDENSTKYNEILIDPPYDLSSHVLIPQQIFQFKDDFDYVTALYDMGIKSGIHGLKDKKVQELIHRNDIHFDLIISEQFFQESWLMFSHKYKAPIITISTYGHSDFFDSAMGLQTPWSFVPHNMLSYSDQMTFSERIVNTILSTMDALYRKFVYLPAQRSIAKEVFGSIKSLQPLPSVDDLEKSISIMLLNTHRSLSSPRPRMPGLIEIGGAGIRPLKPLPTDIQDFLDAATEGVVYVSFGAFVQWRNMPTDKLNEFLEAFKNLKLRILWKCDLVNLPNRPSNVLIRSWLPQSDILGHKNVRLFITHGGLFGTFEGTARGVPMLFMPVFGDQFRNAAKTERKGYGLVLHQKDVTKDTLTDKIKQLVYNNQYHQRAKEVSSLFNDNLVHPMDESIYWIEYVIRHKGATHLRSSSTNMSLCAYYSWDMLGVVFLGLTLSITLIAKLVACFCCHSKSTTVKMGKKRN